MQGRYQNVHRDENNTTIRSGVIREDLRLSRYRDRRRATRGGLRNARKQERVSLLRCFLSAEIARRRFPVITTRPTYMLIRGLSRPPVFRRPFRTVCIAPRAARVFLQARDFVAWNVMRCDVCMYTPTRDGHAPKRLLITSILLPLTAHYRASRNVSFNLRVSPPLGNTRRKRSRPSSPSLKIRAFENQTFRFSHSRGAALAKAQNKIATLLAR